MSARTILTLGADGEPAVVVYDAALKTRAIVSIAQDRPAVVLLDENRRPVFRAP
jgi:hypothetical protein